MDNCIFCKIAAGEIPALTLFEDEDVKVIFDAGPATKGHALVIPKTHAANVFEISDELLAKAHVVAKKVVAKKARNAKKKHHLKGPSKRTDEDDRRFAESGCILPALCGK